MSPSRILWLPSRISIWVRKSVSGRGCSSGRSGPRRADTQRERHRVGDAGLGVVLEKLRLELVVAGRPARGGDGQLLQACGRQQPLAAADIDAGGQPRFLRQALEADQRVAD